MLHFTLKVSEHIWLRLICPVVETLRLLRACADSGDDQYTVLAFPSNIYVKVHICRI